MLVGYVTRGSFRGGEPEPERIPNVRSWNVAGQTLTVYHGTVEYQRGQQRWDCSIFSLDFYARFFFTVEEEESGV